MNVWQLWWLNLAIRATERSDRRVLIGEALIAAIRDRWLM